MKAQFGSMQALESSTKDGILKKYSDFKCLKTALKNKLKVRDWIKTVSKTAQRFDDDGNVCQN